MIIESGYEGGYQLTRERNHEAVITYEYYQKEKVNWYAEKELWEVLKSFGLVKKTIEKSDGTKVEENRYYISSLLLNINLFSYVSEHIGMLKINYIGKWTLHLNAMIIQQ